MAPGGFEREDHRVHPVSRDDQSDEEGLRGAQLGVYTIPWWHVLRSKRQGREVLH